jgi:L-asparaginase
MSKPKVEFKVGFIYTGGTIGSIEKKNKRTELIQSAEELLDLLFAKDYKSPSEVLSIPHSDILSHPKGKPINYTISYRDIIRSYDIIPMSSPFIKFSEDVNIEDLKNLTKEIAELLTKECFSGIIVAHGTDNIIPNAQYTRFSFTGYLPMPIFFIGESRPLENSSLHGALNTMDEISDYMSKVTGRTSCNYNDVYIVDFTSSVLIQEASDTYFISHEKGLNSLNGYLDTIGIGQSARSFLDFKRKNDQVLNFKPEFRFEEKFDQRVKTYKVSMFSDPSEIEYYTKKGYKGLIIEALGSGNGPDSMTPYISDFIKAGGIVAVTSQSPGEKVEPVYGTANKWDKLGVIFTGRTLTSAAHIKLGKALAYTNDYAKIYRVMTSNCFGENPGAYWINNFSWSSL